MTTIADYLNSIRKSLVDADEKAALGSWEANLRVGPIRKKIDDALTELAEVAKMLGIKLEDKS